MSAICLCGVCVPYSAILPLLLIALQYIAKPLHKAGLIPDAIATRIGLMQSTKDADLQVEQDSQISSSKYRKSSAVGNNHSCCDNDRSKNDNEENAESYVNTIKSTEDYKRIISKHNNVIVKMTAEWCKPCKHIHPFYVTYLATRYNRDAKFLVVDVDEIDEIAAEFNVSVLPCFIALKNGKKCGQYAGSDEKKLEAFVHDHCK